ncbi:MAG: protein kinase [Myxococcaceae bacterium]
MADASTPSGELTLALASADELSAAYEGLVTQKQIFIPAPRPLASGATVRFGLTVQSLGAVQLEAKVAFNDVDAFGKPGVVVDLDGPMIAKVRALLDSHPADEIGTAPTRIFGGKAPTAEMPPDKEALEPGALLDNRFQIEAHLASGGMGDVYRAQHVFLKRPVAVKLLRKALVNEPSMWTRFQREAELVSSLESPHVVRVFDFGRTSDGQPYLAMEFVEGETLERALSGFGPMSPDKAVELLSQICEGLEEAHALGIIHRDLKPSNVVLGKKRDGATVAKILDFGIARIADQPQEKRNLTELGIIVGTPTYMAPEQAVGDVLDARTDLYALGCLAFELLTGRPPFVTDTLQELVTAHLARPAPNLASVRPELAAWPRLDEVVQRCLAKDKKDRVASVGELKRLLQAAIAPGAADGVWPPASNEGSGSGEWRISPAPQTSVLPAPPPEWRMTPAPLPSQAPALATQPQQADGTVDDFFAATPTAAAPAKPVAPKVKGRIPEALNRLGVQLQPGVLEALLAARAIASGDSAPGALVRLELLRVRPGQPLFGRCLARLLSLTFEREGLADSVDEDALMVFFSGDARLAAGRAATFALAAREAVHDESRDEKPGATLRGALVTGRAEIPTTDAPLGGDLPELARRVVSKAAAGMLAAERATGSSVGDLVQLKESGELTELVDRRALFEAAQGPLFGRDKVLHALDARLKALAYEVVAPLVLKGRPGSGKTALTQELAVRVRHRSYIVGQARPLSAREAEVPYGALIDMLCNVLGVPREARRVQLKAALEALKLSPGELAAVHTLAGLTQLPTPFTPGQAVHALRSVLKAGAPDRKRVLVFDGLESMDSYSVSAFVHLCTHGVNGELAVGMADQSFAEKRLAQIPAMELPPLTSMEIDRWLQQQSNGAGAGPKLLQALEQRSHGEPGLLVDWLQLLADRGELRKNERGQLILNEDRLPELDPELLPQARAAALPVPVFRLLEAVALAGDGVEGSFLAQLLPDTPPSAYPRLVMSRMLRAMGGRRWAVASERYKAGVLARDDGRRPWLHAQVAEQLMKRARSKTDAHVMDPRVLAQHLLAAHDGARALAAFRHLAESAVDRRAFRDLADALEGSAAALSVLSRKKQVADSLKGQLDMLSRAASVQLVLSDATQARRLLDHAERAAAQEPGLTSVEHELARAKVLRSEARRAKASEALETAETLALGTPWLPLVLAERSEADEAEGELDRAAQALEDAVPLAAAAQEMARWHGEVDLEARLWARLGGVRVTQKDVGKAREAYEKSLELWRKRAWGYAEARVLANLGALLVQQGSLDEARERYFEASSVAEAAGDFFFQAKTLLNVAGVEKLGGAKERQKARAQEALHLAAALGWEDGRRKAEGLL